MDSKGFTKRHRQKVCLHEAGHAVVHAIGGSFVYRLSVAPEGDDGSWAPRLRTGSFVKDVWGLCEPSEPPLPKEALKWDEVTNQFVCHRDVYDAHLRSSAVGQSPADYPFFLAEQRRQLRAHICAWLAGPLVECLRHGRRTDWKHVEEMHYKIYEPYPSDDVIMAKACGALLSDGPECEHACEVTTAALRRPDIWDAVQRLAKELERVGEIHECHDWLPSPENEWPPLPPWIQHATP
jgi:hypothetical protein